ncbi:cell envelope integrity protein TolA (plasmid) [Caballeronia sp. M1242]|nr:cell envelope integrity protein TolA [Caballeronia sp. M1242]
MVVGASHSSSNSETAAPARYANSGGSDLSSKAPVALPATPVPEEPKVITSFDCKKAHSTSEKLICSDAELASLDLDLATVFAQAKATTPDKKGFADAARKAWNWRNANCFNKSCLVTWYTEQRDRLVAIMNQPVESATASEPPIVNANATTSGQSGFIGTAQPIPDSTQAAPSSFYAERAKRRVRPNIIWAGDTSGLETVIAVRLGKTGTLLSAIVSRSSGNPQWDDAALRAVERSDPMPLDVSGEAPASFTITLSPNGDSPARQSGREKAIAWVHAIKAQHPDADSAYESARRNLAAIKASCSDAILLQQTPHRPSEYRPVIMFLSQQCGFIASYWPETNEEQISFDSTMIENWRGYCSSGGPMQTTCVRSAGA